MLFNMKKYLSVLAPAVIAKDGVSFVVIGDFTSMKDLAQANGVFNSINQLKKEATKGSAEDFDFFVTTGDNLYPAVYDTPSDEEFQTMMDLFLKRDEIKDLSIYPVRGNHDCYYSDLFREIELSKKYPTWMMKDFYYESQFDIGAGEKLSLMHVDSCFLLCETVMRDKEAYFEKLDDESKNVF